MPSRIVLVLTMVLLAGCEETANPFVGIEEPYTLFGYLNPRSDRQQLRVIPIAQQIGDEPPQIDAAVTSIDLTTGEEVVWRDTYELLSDSTHGHVFTAGFRPAYQTPYRITVRRSDGATSSVSVTTPVDVRVVPEPNTVPAVLSYRLESDAFPNVVQADMQYGSLRHQPAASGLPPIFFPVSVSYRGKEAEAAGGWRFTVDIRDDYRVIEDTFDAHCLTREYIDVRTMRFVVFVGNDAWLPPGDVFDPEVLAQPGTFSNVVNGFGFVGAGYASSFNAIQPGDVLQAAGFAIDPPCDLSFVSPDSPECVVILPPC